MAVKFNIDLMRQDLTSFGKAASKYIHNSRRLEELERQLSSAANSARNGDGQISWTTMHGGADNPIRTINSSSYRRDAVPDRLLVAELSFKFKGELADEKACFEVKSGSTTLKLKWVDGKGETEFHFDIHPNMPGHPTLHFQFVGVVKDVPRIPAFFIHPLDLLEFILMEVFQKDWEKSRAESACLSSLRSFPVNQRKRISAAIGQYEKWILADTRPALLAVQRTPSPSFNLYPS